MTDRLAEIKARVGTPVTDGFKQMNSDVLWLIAELERYQAALHGIEMLEGHDTLSNILRDTPEAGNG